MLRNCKRWQELEGAIIVVDVGILDLARIRMREAVGRRN
jgi:hypothetical protein